MTSFSQRLCRIWGMGTPYPSHSLVWMIVACVALLELPASAIIHQVNLGLGVVLNEIVFILGISLLVVHVMKFNGKKIFPLKLPRARSVIPLLIAIAGMVIVIDYLTWASEQVWPLPMRYQTALDSIMSVSSPLGFVYKLMLLCFIPGICEEIFFRGFIQTSLAHAKGKWFGIIIAAALFALLHGNPWYFHLYFILGLFLSWMYSVSATLVIPIACHILNNTWTFTNHTLGTTLPLEGASTITSVLILIAGIAFLIIGSIWFSKRTR